ncbi:MAG: hypothetical protein RML32_09450 [Gammaproteobacteria bacterium]|nr:hypothetical protein [Gammaproteobacteria bacterium]
MNALLQSLPNLIQAFRSVVAPPPVAAPESKAIDMLLKGFELAKELRTEAADDGGLLSVVRDLLRSPLLAQAVAATTTSAAPVTPPISSPPFKSMPQPKPQPVSTPTPVSTNATSTSGETEMLKRYLAYLCDRAAAGADPTLYADLILDNLPEFMIRSRLVRKPTALDALIADYPPVSEHRAFFEELIAALTEALNAPVDDKASNMIEGAEVSDRHADATGSAAPSISRNSSSR